MQLNTMKTPMIPSKQGLCTNPRALGICLSAQPFAELCNVDDLPELRPEYRETNPGLGRRLGRRIRDELPTDQSATLAPGIDVIHRGFTHDHRAT